MFEKSLYDLIRGLRNHKGNEKDYVQKSLKECRSEIRSQDIDLKATALLKLIYLEMLGHDMSWASFHVLEVMSSPKYHQKRVGYLGAVQSFRPDTEVLMLATNLLKKDLAATTPTVISLPIATLPHVITPSLALSTLSDLLPRLSHSHSNIRKKTLVTLYRLALVYPEALRAAWPKIKERLMDPDEDPSVTAAIVNVVCELGWRRPHDFLPLAPRLFELLVEGGNNWMAIKLIKLFATLTPLEPRLVRKLLPPLTTLIKTTPAMSLLYECINGIIQGGILGAEDAGAEEIATLCVSKLRGMMVMDGGDANLKYVALLAFNKIVITHPFLVSQQEDVILDCIDSPDITIRIQALDLVQGMVDGDSLIAVVSRLMKQLKSSSPSRDAPFGGNPAEIIESDEEAASQAKLHKNGNQQALALPDDYRANVISRVLHMCSRDNYAHVNDFDWYIDVLTQMVRMAPTLKSDSQSPSSAGDVSEQIGDELRNVAVKVRAMRAAVVAASQVVLAWVNADAPIGHTVSSPSLKSVCWIIGEFAELLTSPSDSLDSLLQLIARTHVPGLISSALQAIGKVFSSIAGDQSAPWNAARRSQVSLLITRIVNALDPLTLHPNLDVQGRAIEFTELLRLTAEAAAQGQIATTQESATCPPLLLTQAVPALFNGWELNSVAVTAQCHVPLPDTIDLNEPIHNDLDALLSGASTIVPEMDTDTDTDNDFDSYYHHRPAPTSISSVSLPAINRVVDAAKEVPGGYQSASEDAYLDSDIIARRRAERHARNKDDPFYIPAAEVVAKPSTPIHNILKDNNGTELDVDSIPIMQLDLGSPEPAAGAFQQRPQTRPKQKIIVADDETLGGANSSGREYDSENHSDNYHKPKTKSRKLRQGLLQVDSSHIGALALEVGGDRSEAENHDQRLREEAEMQLAMKEVERLRLEMQRANERISLPQGIDAEGTVVKRKKQKKNNSSTVVQGQPGEQAKPKKKKNRNRMPPPEEHGVTMETASHGDSESSSRKPKEGTLGEAATG
ncbi:adaptin N terminal region-domain-containing protein [Emericellopsis atlantica]|uniref:AP-3 complex subunit delta n=1 Tax=Emericellopsis atlantica TaxID=2614577 RepID=A0A9P8CSZ2_9HYPO|nr:adaptin N terminal region-domain-containing protein [Emericellopsis atlantica]KAG9258298.1 adaptin N terminal region-domain-containing protein [Emericellopsis atlantica]